MASYFVVLHSTPSEGDEKKKKLVLELAKRLGRKEQDIDILLSDLPAVVTASPTEDFAQALCLAIEELGGLAEMMAEVSGVHAAIAASSQPKSAFKSSETAAGKQASPPKQKPKPERSPRFTSGEHFKTFQEITKPQPEQKKDAGKLAVPQTVDLSFADTANPFAQPAATQAVATQAQPSQAPQNQDTSDLEMLLEAELGGPQSTSPLVPVEIPPAPAVEAHVAPSLPAMEPPALPSEVPAEASMALAPEAEGEQQNPGQENGGLKVISAFSPPARTKKKKKPASKTASPIVEGNGPNQILDPSKAFRSGDDNPITNETVPLEVEEDAPAPPPPMSGQKKILFACLGLLLACYIVLLVFPDLIVSRPTLTTVSTENMKALLKQQDQILKDLKNKPGPQVVRVEQAWIGEELSGVSWIRASLGSSDNSFESGTLNLTMPPAAPLTPEEFSRGERPRLYIKDLAVEKLRKRVNGDELYGKAKITLADQRSIDQIIAPTIIRLERDKNAEVIKATLVISFPGEEAGPSEENIIERTAEGKVRISYRQTLSLRKVPEPDPKEKQEAKPKTGKRAKTLQVMPVI